MIRHADECKRDLSFSAALPTDFKKTRRAFHEKMDFNLGMQDVSWLVSLSNLSILSLSGFVPTEYAPVS